MGVTITAKSPCSKCGGPRDGGRDQYYCRSCAAAVSRAWRAAHPPKKNGHRYEFSGPGWLCPKGIPQVIATISASIVWGICGRAADMPEY